MGKGDRRKRSKESEAAEKALSKRGRPRKEGPREPSGKLQRERREAPEKVMRPALLARAARANVKLPIDAKGSPVLDKAAVASLSEPWMGSVAGRAIKDHKERAALWDVIQRALASRAAWLRCIDAPSEYPKGAAMPVEPDPPQTGVVVDRRHDTRTEQERAEDAERLWNRMSAAMFMANPLLQRVICLDEPVSGPIADWIVRLKDILEQRA